MADIRLTKESRHVLKAIYDIYCDRRKAGESKSAAVRFSASIDIRGLSDVKDELAKSGFIQLFVTDDFELQDKAIIFMENFTKDTILKWLEFGTNFIP